MNIMYILSSGGEKKSLSVKKKQQQQPPNSVDGTVYNGYSNLLFRIALKTGPFYFCREGLHTARGIQSEA